MMVSDRDCFKGSVECGAETTGIWGLYGCDAISRMWLGVVAPLSGVW